MSNFDQYGNVAVNPTKPTPKPEPPVQEGDWRLPTLRAKGIRRGIQKSLRKLGKGLW